MTATRNRIIGYIRVSTDKQGKSGLGLEAQEKAIASYSRGMDRDLQRIYVEVESGKNHTNRPQLALAIAHCRRIKATLVIAKLDRLARNVAFVSALMDSDVNFVACDQPSASRLTLHILAAFAEDEGLRISARTKEGLAAYKARGGLLGGAHPKGHRFTPAEQLRAMSARLVAKAAISAQIQQEIKPIVYKFWNLGFPPKEIAREVRKLGYQAGHRRVYALVEEFENS